MKLLRILIFLLFCYFKCYATVDDSLPEGVGSRILSFPFLLRSPETSWGFGGVTAYFFKAQKNEDNLRTSDINLLALYTLREQTVVVLGSTVFFQGEEQIFRFHGSYSNYPDKCWGLGNNTSENGIENYSLKQIFINPQFIIRLINKLYIGASIEFQKVSNLSYVAGGVFETQNIQGRYGGLTSGAGILLTWDTRNNAFSPVHGVFAEINITGFTKKLGSDFNFSSYVIDFRKFMPAGWNRVLGFQAFSKVNNGPTPIRYLSMLGGTGIMRGLYKGRYTDQNMIAFQTELRQYLFWRLGVAGFAAAGQVSNQVKSFGLNDFHFAYGLGLRLVLQEKEKLNLRVDFGFSEKNKGVYVILKESF